MDVPPTDQIVMHPILSAPHRCSSYPIRSFRHLFSTLLLLMSSSCRGPLLLPIWIFLPTNDTNIPFTSLKTLLLVIIEFEAYVGCCNSSPSGVMSYGFISTTSRRYRRHFSSPVGCNRRFHTITMSGSLRALADRPWRCDCRRKGVRCNVSGVGCDVA